jgi:hypothetical protein
MCAAPREGVAGSAGRHQEAARAALPQAQGGRGPHTGMRERAGQTPSSLAWILGEAKGLGQTTHKVEKAEVVKGSKVKMLVFTLCYACDEENTARPTNLSQSGPFQDGRVPSYQECVLVHRWSL